MKHLIHCAGSIPPGTHVRLSDGRIGIALEREEGSDPSFPPVLIEGRVIQPDRPVRIVTP
jgi:hypothetical protein